jgi:predicted O-methyltransferase YrrM
MSTTPPSNLPDDPFGSVLASMYAGEPQPGIDGLPHLLDGDTRISAEEGRWIYDLCRRLKPAHTLEIGLAYGFSTLYLLAALRKNGYGDHTAVDPFQRQPAGLERGSWHGIGMLQASRVGMSERFSLVEEPSFRALVHFADQAKNFEVIFIDGNHRFDDVLVDFTLAAELCPIGGYIVCDDMWMPSIRSAVAFLRANRTDFEYVPSPVQNIAAFERTAADSRNWDHFGQFAVARPAPAVAIRSLALLRRTVRHVLR